MVVDQAAGLDWVIVPNFTNGDIITAIFTSNSRRLPKVNSKRFFIITAWLAVFGLALAACGGGNSSSNIEPLAVTINGEDIKFDVTAIEAKVGQTVNVTYNNKGALDHTFLIDGLVTEQIVVPGQTITFSFTPKSAGTFEYYCNVAGHKEAGMIGALTVTP